MELHPITNTKALRFQPGDKVGKLTIIQALGSKRFRRGVAVVFECQCDCGKVVQRDRQSLIRSRRHSCGCDKIAQGSAPFGASSHPLFKIWRAMIDRCINPGNKSFVNYGARGIRVSPRWTDGEGGRTGFECFVADMGPKPSPTMTIERSDSDGHYSASNCCWANRTIQSRNRRSLRLETYCGRTQPVSAWAEEYGIPYFTLSMRLRRGWPIERALTEAIHPR